MIKRGEIYLVNFGKKYNNSEFGKVRPALVIQNDVANRNLFKVEFQAVTLLPLTSNITGGSIRVFVKKRDNLKRDSEICINEICTLDVKRIYTNTPLTTLCDEELKEVEEKLKEHLGMYR